MSRSICRWSSIAALVAAIGLASVPGALAAHPRSGKAYTGFTAESANGYRAPVSFRVSGNGRQLSRFTWAGAGCAGMFGGPGYPWSSRWVIYKVGTIRVAPSGSFRLVGSRWTVPDKAQSLYTKTIISTVTGRFRSRDIAAGTISYTEQINPAPPAPALATCSAKRSFTAVSPGVAAGSFGKTAPGNGATGRPTALTLRWGSSRYAARYRYCIDTSANNRCDGRWVSTYTKRSADVTGLRPGKTYYWQVQAVNAHGKVNANGGRWFRFKVAAVAVPAAGSWSASVTASGSGAPGTISVTRLYFTVAADHASVTSFGFAYSYSGGPGKPPFWDCSGSGSSFESAVSPIASGQFIDPVGDGSLDGSRLGHVQRNLQLGHQRTRHGEVPGVRQRLKQMYVHRRRQHRHRLLDGIAELIRR